jgi:DNA helicase-4
MEVIDQSQKIEKDLKEFKALKRRKKILNYLIIGFFERATDKKIKALRDKINTSFRNLTEFIDDYYGQLQKYYEKIQKSDIYLIYRDRSKSLSICKNFRSDIDVIKNRSYFTEKYQKKFHSLSHNLVTFESGFTNYNTHYVQRKIEQYQSFFDKAPFPLDEQQKKAIVTDETHNLVVAGAGSGKTEVLTTRIGYLVERKPHSVNPENILALAYQNKARSEIAERLKSRYNLDVKIKTFHALGLEILTDYNPDNPPQLKFPGDNFEIEYNNYIDTLVAKLENYPEFQKKIIYLAFRFGDIAEKDETGFSDKTEFYTYMNSLEYTALNGVKVKSKAERDILNFFLTHKLNGYPITVLYESPADWMKYWDDEGKPRIPRPDFFFPEYNLYLEHWAVDRNGNVPDWFGGKNPSETYRKNMHAKKERFKSQKRYKLIETFNWEYNSPDFLSLVEKRFVDCIENQSPDYQPELSQMSFEEIIQMTNYECKESIANLSKNVARFIQIAKTYNLTPEKIESRLFIESWTGRQQAFALLALEIFKRYEASLRQRNEIDFQDMINLAVKVLRKDENFYKGKYTHILVDEYQDISTQRYELIKELMKKSEGCKLFCVGDDWQSIMGFSGSNLDLFTHFDHYFDHPTITLLETNYRCCKSIVDFGEEIIKKNERYQIQKSTKAHNPAQHSIEVFSSHYEDREYRQRYEQMLNHVVESIKEYQKLGYAPEDFLILARILKSTMIRENFKSLTKLHNIPRYFPRLMTVHKSKGLQARVVFLLDMVKGLYGFPCELENPDIFDPAILGRKRDRLEEERRLFYVAATRAKEDLKIYTMDSGRSEFLEEVSPHLTVYKM